jgi:hypothetical protein
MIIGSAHSLAQPRISPLQRALSCFPDTEGFARLDNALGKGGLYYANGTIKTFSDVIANPSAGEPTSAGFLVNGSDAPTVVQGYGPELVANGGFYADTSGWTFHGSAVDTSTPGFLAGTSGAGFNRIAYAEIETKIGATYLVDALFGELAPGANDVSAVYVGTSAYTLNLGSTGFGVRERKETTFVATSETTYLSLMSSSSAKPAILDEVSAKEVLPYPGYATKDRPGDEFVLNHDFSAPTDWGFGAGWEIVNGQLVATDVAPFVAATQLRPIEIGARYKVVLDIADIASGTLRAGFSGGTAVFGANFSTAGIKEFELTAGSGNDRIFMNTVNASVSCKINSISIRRIYRDHTIKIEWDGEGAAGDRVVWNARQDANDRLTLHFVSGILRLESFVAGVSAGFVGVPGVDDGGTHGAILYWDEVSNRLSLRVDGGSLETVTATNVPTNLNQVELGHLEGANQLNGLVLEHAVANGDQITA